MNKTDFPRNRPQVDAGAQGDAETPVRDVRHRSDASLIAAIRRDPPDRVALDALIERYWKSLFSRCRILRLDAHEANDLAREAWHCVLRARHILKPDGNFPAYLMTVATNLWRDSQGLPRHPGPLAEHRLAALDAALSREDDDTIVPTGVPGDDHKLLAMNIDRGLERLTPRVREVLVARFIAGESCADISRRYGRTEQTIDGWIREGIQIMKEQVEETASTMICGSSRFLLDTKSSTRNWAK